MNFLEPLASGFNQLINNLSDEPVNFEAAVNSTNYDNLGFDTILGGVNSQAGEIVSPIRGMAVPALFACVRNISEDIGKIPVNLYRRVETEFGDGKERIHEGPINRVLRKQVNGSLTPMTFFETLTQWATSWGNGYAEIVRNRRGDVVEMFPIHPSRVRVTRSSTNIVMYRVHFLDGTELEFKPEDILHIRGVGDELVGWNLPVSLAKETLGSSLAQIMFAASFFGNSAMPAGVLKHPASLSDPAQRRLRLMMRKTYGGARNAAKLLVLEEGMDYAPLSMPLRQAQFIEAREFSVEEVARYYRMPLHKIQSMRQSTNNNIEQQALEYLQDTLQPWITRWTEEMNLKFFPNTEQKFVEFMVDSILAADFDKRTEGYSRLFNIGTMSINEIRAKENMNPIEGGDAHFVPLNMVPLEQAMNNPEIFNAARDNRRQQENPPADGDQESEQARNAKVVQTFTPMIQDAVSIRVNKEIKTLSRHHTKDIAECRSAMNKFYEGDFSKQFSAGMYNAMLGYFKFLGFTGEAHATSLKDDIDAIINGFILFGIGSLNSTSAHEVLEDWKLNRVNTITKEFINLGLAQKAVAVCQD